MFIIKLIIAFFLDRNILYKIVKKTYQIISNNYNIL